MKNSLKLFIVVCILLVFNTHAFGAINKDRFARDRKGSASVIGIYHAELTLDFSSGWNNPTTSYRVLKNELGIDVTYNIKKIRDYIHGGWYRREGCFRYSYDYTNEISFKINNRDFSRIGKVWRMYNTTSCYNGSILDLFTKVGRSGNIGNFNEIINSYRLYFLLDKNIEGYKPDIKSTVTLIILDYLWENPEDEHIDNRDNDNRRDNPNDEGRDHRRRREPLGRMR